MQVTIELPDEIARKLREKSQDLPRQVLESLALESFRSGMLTTVQLRELLGFETRMELDGFLKRSGISLEYSERDLARDLESLDGLPRLTPT
ncbi:MAG TPA: UPF0175 family protein [Armatimonadota bacterium]|jgi:predicted HTH domain antitoxin